MYDIIDLNSRKVAELRDIAKELNIARTDKLKKARIGVRHSRRASRHTSAKGQKPKQ